MESAVIYLRTSTKEQNPETQKKECVEFCKNHGWEILDIVSEQASAFKKDVKREGRDKIIAMAHRGEIKHICVWALDRWVRNRDTLIEDVTILLNYGCKLHGVKDAWLEDINIEGPLGKSIREFLLGLVGSLAQMESERRSERVLMGKRRSRRKQGRKALKLDEELIIKLHKQGLSLKKIAREYGLVHRKKVSHMTIKNFLNKLMAAKVSNLSEV